MTDLFDFHMRVIESDPEGYYYDRWDKATTLVVRAETRDAAFQKVWAVMGASPRYRIWKAKIDRIETALAAAVGASPEGPGK